jgi:transcription elongation factor/antiterminator RfaH
MNDTHNPCWYVVHTHPRQEARAEKNLAAWQVETFNPKLRIRKWREYGGFTRIVTPLFPRYLFVRFEGNSMLQKIRFTRGVHSLVAFGSGPTPVANEIVEFIRSSLDQDGFAKLRDKLAPGDHVRVEGGPCQRLAGVFEGDLDGEGRARVLLSTVSYQAHVIVHKEHLRRI